MNLETWLHETEQQLTAAQVHLGHGTDNYWDEALHLTLPFLGLDFNAPPSVLKQVLQDDQIETLTQARQSRIHDRKPTPYLTGQAWFSGLPFQVDPRVLIPRSPIGELIDSGFYPWLKSEPRTVLDLCCGSACIAIACANIYEMTQIDASDLSSDALAVAALNVEAYDIGEQVHLIQSDLFEGLAGRRYDLIVCNPPYVDAQDMESLPAEFLHEPRMALASGEDGLDFTRRLLRQAADHLTEEGILVVEVGNSADALETIYPDVPFDWVAFENGGDGVFVLTAMDLKNHAAAFAA